MSDALFNIDEENKRYSVEAESIARRLLSSDVFRNRIPRRNETVSETFKGICTKIQDLYDGHFNDRYYPLSEKCLNNIQFKTDGYQKKIKEVKGDWSKVKKLLLYAMGNFKLMLNEDRVPLDKSYLQRNLNLWLYDYGFGYESQSQFILCLNEPQSRKDVLANRKADLIFERLNAKEKDAGNKLANVIDSYINPGVYWQRVEEMLSWGRGLLAFELNAKYWINEPYQIIEEFIKYCDNNNIKTSVSSLNIRISFIKNTPFRWFMQDVINKYKFSKKVLDCYNINDFIINYTNTRGKILI